MTNEIAKSSYLGRRAVLMGAAASTALVGSAYADEAKQPDVSKPAPEGLPKPNQGSVLEGKVSGHYRSSSRDRTRYRLGNGSKRRGHCRP